ncbi:hypothetical protein LCGC14_0569370 [marine sediment metagenome]|uniref:Uncharacterized protein n=1 Tax=marine sediment metagenome TaxID=412755 RepID=A0A0F9USU1_9ZZZZ
MAKTIVYTRKQLTKGVLEDVAKYLNKSIPLTKTPIAIGKDTTVARLIEDIGGVVTEVLNMSDKINPQTAGVIKTLGLTVPEPKVDVSAEEDPAAVALVGVASVDLAATIGKINEALKFDEPIPTGDDEQMKKDILEVATDPKGLTAQDNIGDEARAVIAALVAEAGGSSTDGELDPKPAGKETPPASQGKKAAGKKAGTSGKSPTPSAKKPGKVDVIIEALKGKVKTLDAVIDQAEAAYVKAGGKPNRNGTKKTADWLIPAFETVGAVTISDKGIKANF